MKMKLYDRLTEIKRTGRRSLAMFLTAGYPAHNATPDLVCALEEGGADVVEIGVPFSDPLADGPVIQKASGIAIANGVTLPGILDMVSGIRKRTTVPLVLMGYLNPIMRYGVDRFFRDAASAGVDGVILPELPLEEWSGYAPLVASAGLAGILLAAPTTPPDRVRQIDEASTGFVYCVSTTGVTGSTVAASALADVRGVRAQVHRNPMLVGFGISQPEQAALFGREADGVIVGSALLRRLEENADPGATSVWTAGFRKALDAIKG
jgi:tryptophan synthase alpha chain